MMNLGVNPRKRVGKKNEPFSWRKTKEALGIFNYLKPYKWYFIGGMIMLFLDSGIFMIFPYLAGNLVDLATLKSGDMFSLEQLGMALIVVLIVQAITTYSRVYLFNYAAEKGVADMNVNIYRKLITLPVSFFEENKIGELTSRLTLDVRGIRQIFGMALGGFFRNLILLIVGITFLLFSSPRLSLMMLITFPLIIIIIIFYGRFIRIKSRDVQTDIAETNAIIEENLQNIQVVKVFTNEKYEFNKYQKAIQKVVNNGLILIGYRALLRTLIILGLFSGIFFLIWYGVGLVIESKMTVGELVAFITYTAIIGNAIGGFNDSLTNILMAIGGTDRIREILREDSEPVLSNKETPENHVPPTIEFKNVTFSYPSRKNVQVLKGINLMIPPKIRIALVGQSGAGKSTILALLLNMYKINSGSLQINGRSIYDMDLVTYRSNFGVVLQEVILFGGTIRENILYGNLDANEEEVLEVAHKSYCMEFIEQLPNGIDTLIGEKGVKLSGGQRQRVAIARVMLRNPSVLILDEATNALDAESELVVQLALNELMKNRSTIIIAHRLGTIQNVDQIYVLDKGEIVESGSHKELINMENGVYNSLIKLQYFQGEVN